MPGLCLCEAKSLTSLKVQKTKGRCRREKVQHGAAAGDGETNQRPPSTRSSRRLPRTGHARPRPLRRMSRLRLGLEPRALRPVPGYRLRLTVTRCELRSTRDNLGSRRPREPQGGGCAHRRPGERRRSNRAGAAGGTSASGPGRDRAVAGGSCSPAVVGGGARGSCAVHRGLFHICNNR